MSAAPNVDDGKKEAVKTYIEQTKLLVTLASAFLFAPAGLIAILKDRNQVGLTDHQILWFVVAEMLFIVSVFAGYVVLATIAGWQAIGKFDVYRPATKWSSLAQIIFYVLGLAIFMLLGVSLVA
jgi:hypothetical protein